MSNDITIPPEAVKTAAMALAKECYGLDISDAHKYWTEFKEQAHIAIRAALTAQPAPSPWRPIETAPKDGTQFLTWDSHYGIRVGRCVVRPDHDDWLSYMDAYKGSSKGGIRATHWMPLPPATKEVEP